jgi:hypothetical protein
MGLAGVLERKVEEDIEKEFYPDSGAAGPEGFGG